MEAHRTQSCISWRKARCRKWNEMSRDNGVGAHPHGGDTVEAPSSPAGEQRKCRGVGAGPASRPLLLAELLPPPGGQADAQSPGRARRGGPAPMRRKEKRLLQAVALALAALVLLPNVGLWALYRERQPDGSPRGSGAAMAPAAVQELHSRQKKTFFLGAEQRLKDWHNKEVIRRDAQRVGMEGAAECGHRVSVPWVCAHVLSVLGVHFLLFTSCLPPSFLITVPTFHPSDLGCQHQIH